ncbi:MAG: hypothetical protein ACRERV_04790, partial [Methylococcales bacterium]
MLDKDLIASDCAFSKLIIWASPVCDSAEYAVRVAMGGIRIFGFGNSSAGDVSCAPTFTKAMIKA